MNDNEQIKSYVYKYGSSQMKISVIDKIEEYEQLKSNWEEVYAADPETTIFVSWGWIRGWIDTKSCDWSILALQPDPASSYVAFMPLGMHYSQKGTIQKLFLGAAGHPGADHTGFICQPEYAEKAIPFFADYIKKNMKWSRFELRCVFDSRLDLFLKSFSQRRFYVQVDKSQANCYIILPDNWDQYLKEFLSTNHRKHLRRRLNQIEALKEFRIIYASSDNLETQIEVLLTLWQARFGQQPEDILNRYRAIYRRCFEDNCLLLTIFWDGTVPIGGEASFLDKKKKIMTFFTKAHNEKYAEFSPGIATTGYLIRYAIENGFRICDFGEGAEEYKYTLGAMERFNRNVAISPKTLLGSLKKRIPVKVKKLMRDAYNKNIKRYLTQS